MIKKIPVTYNDKEVGFTYEDAPNQIIFTDEDFKNNILPKLMENQPIGVSSRSIGNYNGAFVSDVEPIEHVIMNPPKTNND